RTLWNIISSCVLTLFACIYSAIHPNIPSSKDSPLRIIRRRLGIMLMALIAPELIVTWARRQWISARQVTKQFKESGYFNVPQPQGQSQNYTWTQTHSFFVLMGGFMHYDADRKPYHTLQPDQLLKLIGAGCIDAPTINRFDLCRST
ncbi:hypothetical protein EDB19DRAFT_1646317, partial [Suillus lakei]